MPLTIFNEFECYCCCCCRLSSCGIKNVSSNPFGAQVLHSTQLHYAPIPYDPLNSIPFQSYANVPLQMQACINLHSFWPPCSLCINPFVKYAACNCLSSFLWCAVAASLCEDEMDMDGDWRLTPGDMQTTNTTHKLCIQVFSSPASFSINRTMQVLYGGAQWSKF